MSDTALTALLGLPKRPETATEMMARHDAQRLQVFCYAPQRRAIESILHPLLTPLNVRVRGVEYRDQIEGMLGGVFIFIPNMVSARVPEHIMFEVRARGFVLWSIDDSEARALHGKGYAR